MLVDTKLCADALWMAKQKFLHPILSPENGGVIGLFIIVLLDVFNNCRYDRVEYETEELKEKHRGLLSIHCSVVINQQSAHHR